MTFLKIAATAPPPRPPLCPTKQPSKSRSPPNPCILWIMSISHSIVKVGKLYIGCPRKI